MALSDQERYQMECSWLDNPTRTFWLGLCRALPMAPRSLAAVALMEPTSAVGYQRIAIRASELRWDGDNIVTEARTFVNMGTDLWPPIGASFLATSRDNRGVLVAYTELQSYQETRQERLMAPRDELSIPIEISITRREV